MKVQTKKWQKREVRGQKIEVQSKEGLNVKSPKLKDFDYCYNGFL
jgi:hypothetical protein